MSTALDRVARDLLALRRDVRRIQTQPQLAFSSVEGGYILWNDDEGNPAVVVGQQFDGTNAASILTGPPPPVPTTPTATATYFAATVTWDGLFVDDALVPMDFSRVEIHAVTDVDDPAETSATLVGTFESPRGGDTVVPIPDARYIKLVARSLSGARSDASVPSALVDPLPAIDTDAIQAALDELNDVTIPGIAGSLITVQADLDTLNDTTIPAITTDLTAATGDITALEGRFPIQTVDLGAGQVTGTIIANDSVTSAKIVANTIVAADIAADTITANEIAANAITTAELAALSVTAAKIVALTITAGQIAANTITAGQITANTITAGQIAANTITAAQIAANTITASQILANTITAGQIAALTITAAQIAANTITAAKIAAGTITATEIAANTITTAKLSATAIDGMTVTGATVTGGIINSGTANRVEITTVANPFQASSNWGVIRFYADANSGYYPAQIWSNYGSSIQTLSLTSPYTTTTGASSSARVNLSTDASANTVAEMIAKIVKLSGESLTLNSTNGTSFDANLFNTNVFQINQSVGNGAFHIRLGTAGTSEIRAWNKTTAVVQRMQITADDILFDMGGGDLRMSGSTQTLGRLEPDAGGPCLSWKGSSLIVGTAGFNAATISSANTMTFHAQDIHSWSGGLFMEDLSGGGSTGATIGNGGRVTRTSSEKMKTAIKPMTTEEARSVLGLESYTFRFKQDSAESPDDPRRYPGFIAEQGAEAGAELWVGRQHKVEYDDEGNRKITRDKNGEIIYFRTGDVTVAHNALIKDLYSEVETLKRTVAELREMLVA